MALTPFRILELEFPAISSLIQMQILENIGEKNPHLLKKKSCFSVVYSSLLLYQRAQRKSPRGTKGMIRMTPSESTAFRLSVRTVRGASGMVSFHSYT